MDELVWQQPGQEFNPKWLFDGASVQLILLVAPELTGSPPSCAPVAALNHKTVLVKTSDGEVKDAPLRTPTHTFAFRPPLPGSKSSDRYWLTGHRSTRCQGVEMTVLRTRDQAALLREMQPDGTVQFAHTQEGREESALAHLAVTRTPPPSIGVVFLEHSRWVQQDFASANVAAGLESVGLSGTRLSACLGTAALVAVLLTVV